MKANTSIQRTRRTWYAVHNDAVHQVEGLSCHDLDGQLQKGAWWVPSLGYTMHAGYHLFCSEDEAKRALKSQLVAQIDRLTAALAKV